MRRIQRLSPAVVLLFLLLPASSLVSQSRPACTAPTYRQDVRQLREASDDGDRAWVLVCDGVYERKR
jgi:hypothetical protein